ncbi:MAG TPA: amidohydrolase family protein [Actinomycetota bacterium]
MQSPLVVLDGGRVAFAGAAAAAPRELAGEADEELVVDGFVLPGVVDRHVHVALSDPAAILAGGVTAVRDLGWVPDDVWSLADASDSPSFDGPTIRAIGPILTCPGGYPTRSGWAPAGTGREVRGAEEAAAAVGEVLDRSGVGMVKVALNADAGPTLTDEELVAICDAAHAREAGVTVHAQGAGQAERAAGAGVDEFAHCPWSERLSDGFLASIAGRMRIVSTLDIHSHGVETPELHTALANLNGFIQAGGRVAYGTDLGNGAIPAGVHVGEAWHLRRAGLTPEQVVEAMTFRPLEAGEPADLIVLGANPFEDLNALADLRAVIHAGRRYR